MKFDILKPVQLLTDDSRLGLKKGDLVLCLCYSQTNYYALTAQGKLVDVYLLQQERAQLDTQT